MKVVDAKFYRQGNVIITIDTNEREEFKSINAAKRRSTELQKSNGHGSVRVKAHKRKHVTPVLHKPKPKAEKSVVDLHIEKKVQAAMLEAKKAQVHMKRNRKLQKTQGE